MGGLVVLPPENVDLVDVISCILVHIGADHYQNIRSDL